MSARAKRRCQEPDPLCCRHRGGVEQLLAAVRTAARPVDALALNAGIGSGGAFLDIPWADEQRFIGLNISSTVHLAKALLPGMVDRGQGRVLVTARMPGLYYATYAASKSFVLSFAEAIRHELADTGVTVTALRAAGAKLLSEPRKAAIHAGMTEPQDD
jgi:short-subunit dehydrogenase